MKNKLFLGLASVLMIAFFSSCDKMPQAEIDAANNAVEQAKVAGAEIYLSEQYLAVQDSMKVAMENLELQKSKLFRNYDEPKLQLAKVAELAAQLEQNTVIKKEEVKTEVQSAIEQVKTVQTENNDLLAKAPKGKEGKAALEAIKSDIDAVNNSMVEIENLFNQGEYKVALDKVTVLSEKAVSINNELKEAIEKAKRARRS